MAAFLKGAVAYKKKIGFTGNLLLEPKPQVLLWFVHSCLICHQNGTASCQVSKAITEAVSHCAPLHHLHAHAPCGWPC